MPSLHADLARLTEEARAALAEICDVVDGIHAPRPEVLAKINHMRKETGLDTPKIMRFVIGNPLLMKEMTKHVPDAGSYAPVTILVDERPDGVH